MAASQTKQPHFLLIPQPTQGHVIPLVDIAIMLAQRCVTMTIVTTPLNAERFMPTIVGARESGLKINIEQLQLPFEAAGLPEGCENVDMLPSIDLSSNFFTALGMLQQPVEELFARLSPRPNCILSDFFLPWTAPIATKFGVPRITFTGFSCFAELCLHNIRNNSSFLKSIGSNYEYFRVPGLPGDDIEIAKAHLPQPPSPNMQAYLEQVLTAERTSYGMILNTFEELESKYIKEFNKVRPNKKAWCIGPVSLSNKDTLNKVQRGNKSSIDQHDCLNWLDLQKPGSVVYVCLGSLSNPTPAQLTELGLGLEASKRPFVWVFKGDKSNAIENWITEDGFEERVKGRGLLIRGWAPQILILSHPAIGGFLTHCGWNSILESISAGVPLITWPLFGDQFLNEKLVVQVLRIGVSVGVKVPLQFGAEEKIGVVLKKQDIEKAINMLMDSEDSEAREMRRRASEFGEESKKAIEEGGSSHINLTMLIEDIMQQTNEEESS
ncbi:UDP-glycosyltransferase 73C4-like [Tripterygium wilfordii]|uniref:UDP-glycosyltransferase 73C4-like n=1 Tax=Tripterygium wilfordii TaxID=458696 RepID=UPI0018F83C66|nr:UDP-glycosyltransferase 73C4-like [Tripterygium wilfordii]